MFVNQSPSWAIGEKMLTLDTGMDFCIPESPGLDDANCRRGGNVVFPTHSRI
jgi:hypothetical protein